MSFRSRENGGSPVGGGRSRKWVSRLGLKCSLKPLVAEGLGRPNTWASAGTFLVGIRSSPGLVRLLLLPAAQGDLSLSSTFEAPDLPSGSSGPAVSGSRRSDSCWRHTP